MFFGRENELNTLNRLYNSNKFEFAVIYGRRRVGKTALINEFTKDKDTIFFTGVETNQKQNLENFSRCIMEYNIGVPVDTSFPSFQAALEYVFELAKTKRIVLVIDEYPYVARASKSLASTLQLLIDKNKDDSKLLLILCGSSMSYMEDHVLAYKAPLYGRRTAQLKIRPFDFFEACNYFTKLSSIDKALAYGIVGGTPQYLMQLDENLSIEENIKNTHLNPASSIFEEPNNLLKQEVREPAIYNAVITAIATGSSKMNEISNKIDEETSVCASYIKNLLTVKNQAARRFTPLRITCSDFGIALCRKILRLFPAEQLTWHTAALPLKFPPTWAACSRTFVNSICGSCSLKEGARSISAILAVGGERILRPRPKKKLILWEPTKMPLYLASASGLAKKLTVVCLRHLWSAAHCSTIRKSIFTSLRKTDLPRAVSTKQLRGAMSRS